VRSAPLELVHRGVDAEEGRDPVEGAQGQDAQQRHEAHERRQDHLALVALDRADDACRDVFLAATRAARDEDVAPCDLGHVGGLGVAGP
jgi:hypothetical protein